MASTKDIEVSLPARQVARLARLEKAGADRDAIIAKALDAYLDEVEAKMVKAEKKR
jgi:hypothetical protein